MSVSGSGCGLVSELMTQSDCLMVTIELNRSKQQKKNNIFWGAKDTVSLIPRRKAGWAWELG